MLSDGRFACVVLIMSMGCCLVYPRTHIIFFCIVISVYGVHDDLFNQSMLRGNYHQNYLVKLLVSNAIPHGECTYHTCGIALQQTCACMKLCMTLAKKLTIGRPSSIGDGGSDDSIAVEIVIGVASTVVGGVVLALVTKHCLGERASSS